MNGRDAYRALALRAARKQVEMLLDPAVARNPKDDLHHAVVLINDLVRHLGEPALAVEFALQFHRNVEIWGDWAAWGEVLDTLLAWDSLMEDDTIQLLIHRSRAARGISDYSIATIYAQSAFDRASLAQNLQYMIRALNQLGRIFFDQDRYDNSMIYFDRADNLNKSKYYASDSGITNINIGNIYVQKGNLSAALKHFHQAIIDFTKSDDQLYIAKSECNIANIYIRSNSMKIAEKYIRSAVRTFNSLEAKSSYALAENDLGCMFLQTKQWQLSLESFKISIQHLEEVGDLSAKAWVMTNLIELFVTTRQYTLAKNFINEGYHLAHLCNKPLVTAGIHFDYARMLYDQGSIPEATELWRQALEIQIKHGATYLANKTREYIEKYN